METISIREAARKYDIIPSTLSRWVKRGAVRVVIPAAGPGLPCSLDAASVAAAVAMYKADPGRGKLTLSRRRLAA